MEEKLEMIKAFIDMGKELRPTVKEAVKMIKSYGPELGEVFGDVTNWMVKKKIDHVKMFEAAGFTREESIYMTMDEWWGIHKKLQNTQKKK